MIIKYRQLYFAQRALATMLNLSIEGDPATALGLIRISAAVDEEMRKLATIVEKIDHAGYEQEVRNNMVEEAMETEVDVKFPTVSAELLQRALERAVLKRDVPEEHLLGSTSGAVAALLPFLR